LKRNAFPAILHAVLPWRHRLGMETTKSQAVYSMTKLLIATPAYGNMFYTPYVRSIIGLQRRLAQRKWDSLFMTISYADIVNSRNYLLTQWYDKTDATHLLFIDADMGYPAKLIIEMIELGKPVVGVIAPKREIDLNRLAESVRKGENTERAIARAHKYVFRPVKQAGKHTIINGFVEVEGCGAGILLIERSCVRRILEKMPEVSDPTVQQTFPAFKDLDRLIRAFDVISVKGAQMSEDYSFCHRWRQQCGGEIWANVRHKITHIGLQRFTGRYADVVSFGPRAAVDKPLKSAKAAASVSAGSLVQLTKRKAESGVRAKNTLGQIVVGRVTRPTKQ
jgi:hypothetical protein